MNMHPMIKRNSEQRFIFFPIFYPELMLIKSCYNSPRQIFFNTYGKNSHFEILEFWRKVVQDSNCTSNLQN